MTCPDAGLWRAHLDGETVAAAGGTLDAHLAGCAACRATVDDLRSAAAFAADHLDALAPPALPTVAGLTLARARPAAATAGSPAASNPRHPEKGPLLMILARRWRPIAAGLAAAAVLTFTVGTPEGQTAAAQFLSQFRSQRFTVIQFDRNQDMSGFAQLQRLGTVQQPSSQGRGEVVAGLAEASRRVGFAVRQPDPATFPAGYATVPEIRVMPASTSRFTFDSAKADAYFASVGRPDQHLPARFNGASIVVRMPAAAMLTYKANDGQGGLMVGQSAELVVDAEGGPTLDEMRDYLLAQPGLPPDAVRQLRTLGSLQNTLPIPVPVGQVQWQETTIAGGQGLILADNSGIGSGAIWNRDSRVWGVAGSLKANDIRRIAESLR